MSLPGYYVQFAILAHNSKRFVKENEIGMMQKYTIQVEKDALSIISLLADIIFAVPAELRGLLTTWKSLVINTIVWRTTVLVEKVI